MARWRLGSDVDQLRSIRSNCIVGFHMNPAASSKGHESTEDLRPRRERLPTHFLFLYGLQAALSGASVRQLSYWRLAKSDEPLLAPEFHEPRSRVSYSFRDAVALRAFVFLRSRRDTLLALIHISEPTRPY